MLLDIIEELREYCYLRWRENSFTKRARHRKYSFPRTVEATAIPRQGESAATLKLYKAVKDDGGNYKPGDEVPTRIMISQPGGSVPDMIAEYGPTGGKVFVVLEIKVGPDERVDATADNISIEVTEENSIHNPYPPAIRRAGPHSQLNCFNLNGGGQWEKKVEPCNADSIWLPLDANETPKTTNMNNPSHVVYRAKALWDTTQVPLGHNARHKLHTTINGDPKPVSINKGIISVSALRGEWCNSSHHETCSVLGLLA